MKIIKKRFFKDNKEYYDLEIPNTHTYVLGNGVVVHNCGTGAGFSVERKYVNKLPGIKQIQKDVPKEKIVFEDSKLGWAKGYEKVVKCLWEGQEFECDYSKVRPKGARLKTFGGRSSGPDPLRSLVDYTTKLVEKNRGNQLQCIDAHDICCKIADVVVVGGVRRSALISFSDLTDNQMAAAKQGQFWNTEPQRQLANNSVAYTRKPDILSFLNEWKHLISSQSGERGIMNRNAFKLKAAENHRRNPDHDFGGNPCMEIILRPYEFCNLTEVVVRPKDGFDDLKRKIKIATMLGTWQATFTNFNYVNKKWKENCEEERLLGVSLTGVRDHKTLGSVNDTAKKWLSDLKHIAISQNKKWAEKLKINPAAAITCLKPSGTVSSMVDSAAGLHTQFSDYYIRRVRINATDPLFYTLKDQGVPYHCENGQSPDTCNTFVFDFPCKSPSSSRYQKDLTAREQLEYWHMFRTFFCEHNPSVTVYVKEHEWLFTAARVMDMFDEIGGISFLPYSDHVYQLAPYEEISKEQYEDMVAKFPHIDFTLLGKYETEDHTQGAKEYACSGGKCDLK